MKKIIALIFLVLPITSMAQTPYWLSGDGYNIYNGNPGNVLLGLRSPFGAKLSIDAGNEAYGLSLTSDMGQFGNYVQIGMLGRNMDLLQGRMLFNLYSSNKELKYTGFDFRIAEKSAFFINGEGNVGIGTITKNPPIARLQIEGGPIWSNDGYKKSLFLGAQDAIGFNGGGYKFGIGANGSSLNFFSTLQESNAQMQPIMSLQNNSVTVEGDLIVKGNVYTDGQGITQKQQTNQGNYGPILGAVGDSWTGVTNGISYTNGNVGIGSSAPASLLHLKTSGSSNLYLQLERVSNKAGVYFTSGSTGLFYYHVDTSNALKITAVGLSGEDDVNPRIQFPYTNKNIYMAQSGGYVGIGTSTPAYLLDVVGTINAQQILVNGSPISGGSSQWTTSGSGIYYTTGNVGIGTSSPTWKLHIGTSNNGLRVEGPSGAGTAVSIGGNGDFSIDAPSIGGGRFIVKDGGAVGIGTGNPDVNYKLSVNGKIKAHELYLITTGWADFVFKKDYKLRTLKEVEEHIQSKGHLPDIPSEKEVMANGVAVVDMQAKLLQKIEELTLYVIQQQKEIEILKSYVSE